jgi:serine/threonine protein kinase
MIEQLREAYRDVVELGHGREGVRFSAVANDGTPVVGLALAPDVGARIESHDRFAAALQRAASVHHMALAGPVTWGALSDGTLHCAYPQIDSRDVAPGSLSPAMVAAIGVQIARALGTCHGSGLVHGAISTKRIILPEGRGAMLGDFGLFAALCDGGLEPKEATALLVPSGYASPEALLGSAPDARSDIYSLGACLYELLTGKPPYGGRMTSYVLASVLSEAEEPAPTEPASAVTRRSQSNLVVDALVRAIEQAPEDRWPNAEGFASALASSVSTGEMAAVSGSKRRAGCLPAAAAILGIAGLVVALVR